MSDMRLSCRDIESKPEKQTAPVAAFGKRIKGLLVATRQVEEPLAKRPHGPGSAGVLAFPFPA